MATRKEIVRSIVVQGMPVSKALAIAEIPHSSFYYKSNDRRVGKAPSTHTRCKDIVVENETVVEEINSILGGEFIDYGYERTTAELKKKGYHINKKKVYRLMKENHLLFPKIKVKPKGRQYVDFTIPQVTRPLEVIELDIKYIYLHGKKRHAYLITMLDVFSRTALVWDLNLTMKAKDAVRLVEKLIDNWIFPLNYDPQESSVRIRTDNGSQFIADAFKNSLKLAQINHEYIRPATPQQNAHIESFHNTLSKLVCRNYYFEDVLEARTVLERFFLVYNNQRIMKSILNMAPMEFMKSWLKGQIGVKIERNRIKYFLREKPTEYVSEGLSPETFVGLIKDNHFINKFINPC